MTNIKALQRARRDRALAQRYQSALALVQSRTFLGGVVLVVALALVVAHGVRSWHFVVDEITLGLLGFAAAPFVLKIVTTLKAGNVEVAIRDLSVGQQVVTFLDGIATKRQWTFFAPRADEENMGPAFVALTEELIKDSRTAFVAQLRKWMSSEDVNQRWFAAEIVGYHKVTELRRALERAPENKDIHEAWQPWELNCLWAVSRLDHDEYQSLLTFLLRTKNRRNQAWVLNALDQMIGASLAKLDDFSPSLKEFVAGLPEPTEQELVGLGQNLRYIRLRAYLPRA